MFASIEKLRQSLFAVDAHQVDHSVKQAAVLMLLIPVSNSWDVLFTRRTDLVQDHKGQVSFPGGSVESTDQSLAETALRECHEEIGLLPSEVELLGSLPTREAVTGVTVYPFVGTIVNSFTPKPMPIEVARVFTIPLNWLTDQNHLEVRPYVRPNGLEVPVIYYQHYDGELLWGLTARIVQDFIVLTNINK